MYGDEQKSDGWKTWVLALVGLLIAAPLWWMAWMQFDLHRRLTEPTGMKQNFEPGPRFDNKGHRIDKGPGGDFDPNGDRPDKK